MVAVTISFPSDDVLAPYSSYGTSEDGFAKPDAVAPGTNLISVLTAKGDDLPSNHPDHIVYYAGNPWYFRMSGTSMAAAVVTGAAALLAQLNPNLTPDQIKACLINTANPLATSVAGAAGAGEINVYAAVHSTDMSNANTGTKVSPLLQTGSTPITWTSANWTSANWTSVNWSK